MKIHYDIYCKLYVNVYRSIMNNDAVNSCQTDCVSHQNACPNKMLISDAMVGAMIQKSPQEHSHVGVHPACGWSRDSGRPKPRHRHR